MTSIWPPIVVILLFAVGFGISVAKAGETRSPHNPLTDLLGTAIMCSLLYWGGFFEPLLR